MAADISAPTLPLKTSWGLRGAADALQFLFVVVYPTPGLRCGVLNMTEGDPDLDDFTV